MRRGAKLLVVAIALIIATIALWPRNIWQARQLEPVAIKAVRERAHDQGLRFANGLPATLHDAGRQDMRALCGWVSSSLAPKPRFFFVLFEGKLFGVGVRDVFVQDTAGQTSGSGVEAFCRRPPVST